MATTIAEVREVLRAWIHQVLNTEGEEALPIVFSHQNAPAPLEPYVVIDSEPTRSREGREAASMADGSGNQSLYEDYEDVWTLEEIGGYGDRLRTLIESQGRQDIRDRFAAAGIGYRGQASAILPLRELVESAWRNRHTVDIRVGVVSKTTYEPGLIETVQYAGDIAGHQRSGTVPEP